jgi:DNA-binding GntR family transcriptional regulator
MREDILTGGLPPGDKLRSEFLRTRYEVGTSPMREALNRLAADGLVVHEDQRGFRVAAVSAAELEELLKTRCWLEEIALRQSIINGDAEWEETIVLSFHRLSRQPRSANEDAYAFNPEWERLHHDFHRNLLSACGSRWLAGYCDQLNDQTLRYRQIAAQVDDPRRNEVEEHREIMEAAIARDADLGVKLLIQHFEDTNELIRNHVPDMRDAAPSGKAASSA